MKKKLLLFMSLCLLSLTVLIPKVNADANTFSITPLTPETNEPQSSYYDLKVSPNERMKLTIRVFNSSDEDIHVKVEANDGSTNNNGITSYLGGKKRDKSLTLGFSDIAKINDKDVVIPKNGKKDVSVSLNIPSTKFDGVILGGIRVSSLDQKKEDKEKAAVTNNIAYTIGVVLSQSEKKIDPDMQFLSVITEQRNYRNYISAQLQNPKPRIIKKLEVTAKVTKIGFKEVPNELTFESTRLSGDLSEVLVNRVEPDWKILVTDLRGTNLSTATSEKPDRSDWEIAVSAQPFKDENNKEIPFTTLGVAYVQPSSTTEITDTDEVVIVSHSVENEIPKTHSQIENSWTVDEGLKAIVHNRNDLDSNKKYTAELDLELRQAP